MTYPPFRRDLWKAPTANLTQRGHRVVRGRSRYFAFKLPLLNLISLTLVATPVVAQSHQPSAAADERQIAGCIHRSARGKPWLETTLRGLRYQEGGWIGAAVPNRDGSHDLGPMQINSWWVPRIARLVDRPASHVRQWLRDDPCFNVEAARWVILTELAAGSGYWGAIGRYHSPIPWRQRRYTAAVVRKMAGHFRKGEMDNRHHRPSSVSPPL